MNQAPNSQQAPALQGHHDQDATPSGTSRWNLTAQFPWKLHRMLEDAEVDGFAHIVSWMPDALAFRVHHNNDLFVEQVLPLYFRQTRYKSFQRQLNMWGFERITCGMNYGGYSHTFFVRGQVDLCKNMTRTKIKRRQHCLSNSSTATAAPSPPQVTSTSPSSKVLTAPVRHTVTPTTTPLLCQVQEVGQARFAKQDVAFPLLPPTTQAKSSPALPDPNRDLFDEESLASCLLWDPVITTSSPLRNADERILARFFNSAGAENVATANAEDEWSLELQPTPLPPHHHNRPCRNLD